MPEMHVNRPMSFEEWGDPARIAPQGGSPPDNRQIAEQLDRLEKFTVQCREAIEHLSGRLSPVMTPEPPRDAKGFGRSNAIQPVCPLAGQIESIADRTQEASSLIANLLSRLQL